MHTCNKHRRSVENGGGDCNDKSLRQCVRHDEHTRYNPVYYIIYAQHINEYEFMLNPATHSNSGDSEIIRVFHYTPCNELRRV